MKNLCHSWYAGHPSQSRIIWNGNVDISQIMGSLRLSTGLLHLGAVGLDASEGCVEEKMWGSAALVPLQNGTRGETC